jgi:hypothetical protein
MVKTRPQTPLVRQQFIINASNFEFGPLLCGRNKEANLEATHPDHAAKFRITNNGLFDLHADFWLKSEGAMADPAAVAAAAATAPVTDIKGAKKGQGDRPL